MKWMWTVLVMTGCALNGGARDRSFEIGVFGDVPYIADESQRAVKTEAYRLLLEDVNARPLSAVVHIGDFVLGGQCSDSIQEQRAREFEAVRHPLIYLPGDNEWTDCGAPYDPLERLDALRARFGRVFGGRLAVTRQAAPYVENVRWVRDGVLFVSVHAVGSNNNWGPDTARASAEYLARNRANLEWLRAAFAEAERIGAMGVAVFTHANFWSGATSRGSLRPGFRELAAELETLALGLGRPVALVHGDTHYFRVDKPFEEAGTRRVRGRITRAETFGDPNPHWLLMRVDPDDPDVFSFRPMLVRGSL